MLLKRLFDIIGSAIGLLVLAPLLMGIALAVWIADGRPLFFRQWRVGKNHREFRMIKFRTMRVAEGADKGRFDAGSSQRVTQLGRFLRRSKLDELPELWNVLKGDMSLVGPRPEVRQWVEVYPERWQKVLTVRPGITDPASIRFRHEEELLAAAENPEQFYREQVLPEKLDIYEMYVASPSMKKDVKILWRTMRILLVEGRGSRVEGR